MMTKTELIKNLSVCSKIQSFEAKIIVDIFFDSIRGALIANDRAEIRGLCTFTIKKYKGYLGRNPKTGKTVAIKSKKLPFFKCSRELKIRVNYIKK